MRWDYTTDVVVVGYGFAGGMAAIGAHDAGASVLMLEKMDNPGGISIASAGGIGVATDVEGAMAYLRHTCGGRTPEAVLRAFAEGLVRIPGIVKEMAGQVGVEIDVNDVHRGGTYDFPGTESIGAMKIPPIEGLTSFPWAPQGLRGGARLFKVVYEHVQRRKGIEVWCSASARRLITNAAGEVIGVNVEREGRVLQVGARRGVVLTCGGYEFDEEYKLNHFQAMPVYGVTSQGNTGDGLRMAQAVGAGIWHMWMYHGGYGFKFPEYPVAFRHRFLGFRDPNKPMPWIAVDRYGRRFMNEYHPAPQDTGCRPLDLFDPDRQEHPRIPCYLIFDEEGRKLGPLATPIFTTEPDKYKWSSDNLAEVERGWIQRAPTLEALAQAINQDGYGKVDAALLAATVNRWNDLAGSGEDADHGRLPGNLFPIAHPPYYAIAAWPVVSNTQGGPMRNERQEVLNPFGEPIGRLYSAGELGSLFGHLYMESGNVAECFIGGLLAGTQAAGLPPVPDTVPEREAVLE